DFSAVVNYGDGTAPVTITSTASANGQIIADASVPGQFDVVGNHTFAEEGKFTVVVTVTDLRTDLFGTTASFDQSNLVTDNQSVLSSLGYAAAAHVDTNLVNSWGLAASPSGPFWVADNGTGVSTLYDGNGNPFALVV